MWKVGVVPFRVKVLFVRDHEGSLHARRLPSRENSEAILGVLRP
jgi:hypothetical protein